ncbi:MAG: polysaccharide biosynthesis C-terminal domain-containing protein [Clostridia bacterium]|nr:polysaccharide biosynthesis C-terminal domain-containing protein [Clostridia bacterium]
MFKVILWVVFCKQIIKIWSFFWVLGALVGISISELFALIFIFLYYIFSRKKNNIKTEQGVSTYSTLSKQLLSMALPITFGGLAYPIVSIIDSVLVVNLLMNIGYSSTVATEMYGIEFGVVDPLINIPIIIAVAVSSSILPNISKVSAIGDKQEQKRLVEKALQITLSVSLACAICYVVFGKQILSFLYGGTLTTETLKMATILLFLGCINLIFMSLVQVSSGILQGLGKHKNAASSIGVGALIKVVLTIVLVGNPRVNIYGVMISGGVSYLAVFVANYLRIKKETSLKLQNIYFGVSIQECAVCLVAFFSNYFLGLVFGGNIALFGGGFIAVIIFAVSYYILFVLKSKGEDYST